MEMIYILLKLNKQNRTNESYEIRQVADSMIIFNGASLLLVSYSMMLLIVIQLFLLIIETRSCQVTTYRVNYKEKESYDEQSQYHINCDLSTCIKQVLPSAILIAMLYMLNYMYANRLFKCLSQIITMNAHPQPSSEQKHDSDIQHQSDAKDLIFQILQAVNSRKKVKLTNSQQNIYEILTNQRLFQQAHIDQTIFKSDLVIKISIPKINYKSRNLKMELGSILRKFPKAMHKAYEAAYEELYSNMQQVRDQVKKQAHNDKQLQIRQFSSFFPLNSQDLYKGDQIGEQESKIYTKTLQFREQHYSQEIKINCTQEATIYLDSFIITYNSLIYALQQFCGFKVKAFLVSYKDPPNQQQRKQITQLRLREDQLKKIMLKNMQYKRTIYVLLYLPDHYMIKAANKYSIKKQIDYTQVDPFLNQPTDDANRPFRYHSEVLNYLAETQKKAKQSMKQNGQKKQSQDQFQQYTRKKIERKIGLSLVDDMKSKTILNEVKLSQYQINSYCDFKQELENYLLKNLDLENQDCFNNPQKQDVLTEQQRNYLLLVNRRKLNLGVEKSYLKLKKRRKYFRLLKQLSNAKGYKTFDQPLIYSSFKLASKSKKFFSRLQQILLYKQTIISPQGELALFNKMQRIKLSYLVLKQYIRVENMYMLYSSVFALGDEYEKFGTVGLLNSHRFHYHYKTQDNFQMEQSSQKDQIMSERKKDLSRSQQKIENKVQQKIKINGGLNGRNLDNDWSQFLVWRTNFNTIRNYLGQSKTFEVFIKTNLIKIFVFLAPMGILFQIAKFLIINPNNKMTGYFPEFWFYLAYMIVITIAYGVFVETYRRAEINYIDNFVQENKNTQFIHEYRGPYIRDSTNDNANTYDEKFVAWKDKIRTYLIFSLFFLIVFAQIGFYYGIRSSITQFSYIIPSFFEEQFELYRPIHLIGYSIFFCVNSLIYNLVICPFAHWITKYENKPTKQAYVSSQNLKLFIFAIGIEMIGPIDLVFIQYSAKTSCLSEWCANQLQAYVYCRYILILFFTILSALLMLYRFFTRKKVLHQVQQNKPLTYSKRLSLFLQFVYEESIRQPCDDIKLIDQTISLIHFATFLTVFPLGPTISFFSMFIDYNVERLQILKNQQRPIPKSEGFHSYRKIVVAIGHWMLFFNFSQIFITLEWLQYLFPNLVLAIMNPPSPYALMTLKYCTILIFMVVFQCILKITRSIVKKFHSVLDKRKWKMFDKKAIKIFNQGVSIQLKQPKPLHSISRTYNYAIKRDTVQTQQTQVHEEANTMNMLNKKHSAVKKK